MPSVWVPDESGNGKKRWRSWASRAARQRPSRSTCRTRFSTRTIASGFKRRPRSTGTKRSSRSTNRRSKSARLPLELVSGGLGLSRLLAALADRRERAADVRRLRRRSFADVAADAWSIHAISARVRELLVEEDDMMVSWGPAMRSRLRFASAGRPGSRRLEAGLHPAQCRVGQRCRSEYDVRPDGRSASRSAACGATRLDRTRRCPHRPSYLEYLRQLPDAGAESRILLATVDTARRAWTELKSRFRRTCQRTLRRLRIPSGGRGLRCADRSPGVVGKERSAGWVPGPGASPTFSSAAKTWTAQISLGDRAAEFSGATRISVRGASPSGRVGVHRALLAVFHVRGPCCSDNLPQPTGVARIAPQKAKVCGVVRIAQLRQRRCRKPIVVSWGRG